MANRQPVVSLCLWPCRGQEHESAPLILWHADAGWSRRRTRWWATTRLGRLAARVCRGGPRPAGGRELARCKRRGRAWQDQAARCMGGKRRAFCGRVCLACASYRGRLCQFVQSFLFGLAVAGPRQPTNALATRYVAGSDPPLGSCSAGWRRPDRPACATRAAAPYAPPRPCCCCMHLAEGAGVWPAESCKQAVHAARRACLRHQTKPTGSACTGKRARGLVSWRMRKRRGRGTRPGYAHLRCTTTLCE